MSYSDNMVEPGAIVEALNKETEYTTKKHKLKKKYKIAEYNQWQIKDGKLDFVK